MTEYTVHFQKGWRVGTRSLHMVHVEADSVKAAIAKAKAEFKERGTGPGYVMKRVDHFEDDRIVIDWGYA